MHFYRPDIDGLRALAILPVLLFHAGFDTFSGGFVGVDVFFVISGFLITSIIIRDLDQGKFSLTDFYERRIRRILPAFLAMMTAVAITAYFVFLPYDFNNLSKNFASALVFFSNIRFWKKTGYFDGTNLEKPVLHTWSLGVEEQFYIVLPLLLMGIAFLCASKRRIIITGLFLISFVSATAMVEYSQRSAFYLLPFRAWELLAGSLIALGSLPLMKSAALRTTVAAGALFLILAPVFLLSKGSLFPGLTAVPVVLGTALLLQLGQNGLQTPVHRLMSQPVLTFIGKISFSLYLWHWPVIVFYSYLLNRAFTPGESLFAIALSLLLAIASYYVIEQPVRKRKILSNRKSLFGAMGTCSAILLAAGLGMQIDRGLPDRFSPEINTIIRFAKERDLRYSKCFEITGEELLNSNQCLFGETDKEPSFIVWGDSHADALAPAFALLAEDSTLSWVFAGKSACVPLTSGHPDRDPHCQELNQNVLSYLAQTPSIETVYLVARWSYALEGTPYGDEQIPGVFYRDNLSVSLSQEENLRVIRSNLTSLLKKLEELGKRIVILDPVPEIGKHVPRSLALEKLYSMSSRVSLRREDYEDRNKIALEMFGELEHSSPHIRRISPQNVLCDPDRCATLLEKTPLYRDDDHLTTAGAQYLFHTIDQWHLKLQQGQK